MPKTPSAEKRHSTPGGRNDWNHVGYALLTSAKNAIVKNGPGYLNLFQGVTPGE